MEVEKVRSYEVMIKPPIFSSSYLHNFYPFATSMIFKVGMGEGIVAEAPHIILSAGLGSCVAVTIYDIRHRIGGLAHIMIPTLIKKEVERMRRYEDKKKILTSQPLNFSTSVYQCANTAIPALIEEMFKKGAARQGIMAKMAGGARMFPSYSGINAGIGEQNIISVRRLLKKEGIPLVREDTGGSYGRSVEFYLDSGMVIVKAFGRDDREI
jgi:chemotaxis protein CheD